MRKIVLAAAVVVSTATLGTMLATTSATTSALAGETAAPADAKVYFINLKDGAKVINPFVVQFGLTGMGVAPAGVEKEKTGHHHLLIDTELKGDELNQPIPADEQHKHFGAGQTEASITLPPGTHTLQLVLGDWSHIPHKPPVMSEKISITVEGTVAKKEGNSSSNVTSGTKAHLPSKHKN